MQTLYRIERPSHKLHFLLKQRACIRGHLRAEVLIQVINLSLIYCNVIKNIGKIFFHKFKTTFYNNLFKFFFMKLNFE